MMFKIVKMLKLFDFKIFCLKNLKVEVSLSLKFIIVISSGIPCACTSWSFSSMSILDEK